MWVVNESGNKVYAYYALEITRVLAAEVVTLNLRGYQGRWWYKSATTGQTTPLRDWSDEPRLRVVAQIRDHRPDDPAATTGAAPVLITGLTANTAHTFSACQDEDCTSLLAKADSFTTPAT